MKFLVLFALVAVVFAAPRSKKVFHDNVNDFLNVIIDEVDDELDQIMENYLEFEEFQRTIAYVQTANFKELVYDMEALPEFKAVLDSLEAHNIDVHYFIDQMNLMMEFEIEDKKGSKAVSGKDFSSFIEDSIAIYPKEKLTALYDQKIAEDEDFKAAIESFQSDEWNQVYSALWANEQFLAEVNTLAENGIDVQLVLKQLVAVFGQN